MGKDKAEIRIDGARMIDRAIYSLRKQDCDIIISASHDYGTGLQYVQDLENGPRGPVAALFAGYKSLKNVSDIDGFITVPVDSPNFPDNLVKRLKSDDHSQIAAGPDRIHPTFGWWRLSDLKEMFDFEMLDGKISLTVLAKQLGAKTVTWKGENLLLNINDPNDLNAYLTAKSPPHKES